MPKVNPDWMDGGDVPPNKWLFRGIVIFIVIMVFFLIIGEL